MNPARGDGRQIAVRNRQRKYGVDRDRLRRTVERAADLVRLRHVELGVVLVSDRKISGLNRQFHGTPGPTDILTFDYGDSAELIISLDHVRANARRYGTSPSRELTLYVVHGLLHLAGHRDGTAAERERMRRAERRVLRRLLPGG
jgi:probable rRNA maturation factor